MRALEESAYYEIAELYIEGVEGGLFAVNYAEELEDGEHYVVKMRPTMKTLVEDEISEVEETALPKKTKTRLRRVEGQVRRVEGEQGGAFAVDVAEVYSPPRIASTAEKAVAMTLGHLKVWRQCGTAWLRMTRSWQFYVLRAPHSRCCSL